MQRGLADECGDDLRPTSGLLRSADCFQFASADGHIAKDRLVGFLCTGRPLANNHLQVMHKRVEHLQRMTVIVESLLRRFTIHGKNAFRLGVGQTFTQPTRNPNLTSVW